MHRLSTFVAVTSALLSVSVNALPHQHRSKHLAAVTTSVSKREAEPWHTYGSWKPIYPNHDLAATSSTKSTMSSATSAAGSSTVSTAQSSSTTSSKSSHVTSAATVATPSTTASGVFYSGAGGSGTGTAAGTGTATAGHGTGTGTSSQAAATGAVTGLPSPFRGVNIGNWLILEKWMDPSGSTLWTGDAAGASDQWTFDQSNNSLTSLTTHWQTWFNETNVKQLSEWGINTMRIPIGYWSFYNDTRTPYHWGAQAYLDLAIGWAQKYNMKVLVDVHGSPGSQNGFDNSGHSGPVEWQSGDNLNLTYSVLATVAKKYATPQYANTVFGIELTNEPISWGNNNNDVTKQFAKTAFHTVQNVSTNPNLVVIMHDAFLGPSWWEETAEELNGGVGLDEARFWIDTHLYQNQNGDTEVNDNQAQHIQAACNWTSNTFLSSSSNLPVIVGEFSASTDICANTNGSTTAGTSCSTDGCQCSATVDINKWNSPLITATGDFLQAQIKIFEQSSKGWFMWAHTGPGAWGFDNVMNYRVLPGSVDNLNYTLQCSGGS